MPEPIAAASPRVLFAWGLFFIAVFCLAAAGSLAAKEGGGSLIVVFDGSGSMWGNLPGGGAKFELAHAALAKSLPDATGGIKTGLVTFGPGCGRSYTLSEPEVRSGANTVAPLQSLNPKSKGPVTVGIEASEALLESNQPGAILLIADGPDNCGQDLCAAAERLARERPGLKIHTVGLGLDQPVAELACASRLTKGRYFTAATRDEVETAVAGAVEIALADLQIRAKPTLAKRPQKGSRAALQINPKAGPQLVLNAQLGGSGKPVENPVRWQVYQSSGEPDADALAILDVLEPRFAVPVKAGDYYIKASLGRATFAQAVTAAEDQPTFVKAVFDAGQLLLSVDGGQTSRQTGGEPGAAAATLISVRKADDKSGAPLIVSPYPQSELILPAGRYQVRAESGPLEVTRVVDIEAGSSQALDLPLNAGELVLSADAPIGGVQAKEIEYIVSVDDPDRPGGRRRVARSAARSPSFGLPAGTYYVEARSGLASTTARVALGAGKRVEKSLSLALARIAVETDAPLGEDSRPQPIVYKLYRLNPLVAVARSSARSPSFTVQPGRYRIVAEIGARNVKAVDDVDLEAGEASKVALGVLAGNVRLSVVDRDGGALGGQFWEVSDASGSVIWRTQLRSPAGLLAPGQYRVRCETRKGIVEGTFEVAAGDAKTVELRHQ